MRTPTRCGSLAAALGVVLVVPTRAQAGVAEVDLASTPGQLLAASLDAAAPATAARAAATLAGVGAAVAPLCARLVEAIPRTEEPVRSHLLRALANGALAADADARAAAARALPQWRAAGLLFAPAADRPSFAWYESVRLEQRLRLAAAGGTAKALGGALDRQQLEPRTAPILVPPGRRDWNDHHTFDWNSTNGERETVEAVAELALAGQGDVVEVLDRLAEYLRHNRPGARIPPVQAHLPAEVQPDAAAARWPVLWQADAWRIAVARTLLRGHPDAEVQVLALRHLLRTGDRDLGIEAIATVRTLAAPHEALAPDLAALLVQKDRTLVREVLVTLSQSRALARHATVSLARIARGSDAELALLAHRAQDLLER